MSSDLCKSLSGKWKEEKSEGLEEVFKEIGANYLVRKMIAKAHPEMEMAFEGNEVTITMKLPMKTQVMKLKLGESVSVDNMGEKAMAETFEQGDELVTIQIPEDKGKKNKMTMRRKIVNGQFIMVMEVRPKDAPNDSPPIATATRYFNKMEQK